MAEDFARVASMEPDLIGQEKFSFQILVLGAGRASMEPDLIGQEKSRVSYTNGREGIASMEPDLIGQEKRGRPSSAPTPSTSLNGA